MSDIKYTDCLTNCVFAQSHKEIEKEIDNCVKTKTAQWFIGIAISVMLVLSGYIVTSVEKMSLKVDKVYESTIDSKHNILTIENRIELIEISKVGKTMDVERRNIEFNELRVSSKDKKPTIIGYAAVFNRLSEDLGGFREKIKPGAFRDAIKSDDVRALINHDFNYPIGRVKNNSLKLKEDRDGLLVEITPPDTTYAKDLIENIRSGLIDSMSFGFSKVKDSWSGDKSLPIRTLEYIGRLIDVSPVVIPAYPDTAVAVRSLKNFKQTISDVSFDTEEADYNNSPSIDINGLDKITLLKIRMKKLI